MTSSHLLRLSLAEKNFIAFGLVVDGCLMINIIGRNLDRKFSQQLGTAKSQFFKILSDATVTIGCKCTFLILSVVIRSKVLSFKTSFLYYILPNAVYRSHRRIRNSEEEKNKNCLQSAKWMSIASE